LGLGVAGVVAPSAIAGLVGVPVGRVSRAVITAIGAREIASGVGLLSRRGSRGWSWFRLMGDAVDLALLASAFGARSSRPGRLLASVAAVGAVTLADGLSLASKQHEAGQARSIGVHANITIQRNVGEVYRFWRDLSNVPSFMQHIEDVTESAGLSHWRARGPLGTALEWDAEVTDDRPEQSIAWQSREGASVPNRGSVSFVAEPHGVGTEVHVELAFEPPGGALGASLARLFDELPEQWLRNDLRRLKQILETGEVVRSDASVHRGPHPARPPQPDELQFLREKKVKS
jgi:uncharacterized membrane protein